MNIREDQDSSFIIGVTLELYFRDKEKTLENIEKI